MQEKVYVTDKSKVKDNYSKVVDEKESCCKEEEVIQPIHTKSKYQFISTPICLELKRILDSKYSLVTFTEDDILNLIVERATSRIRIYCKGMDSFTNWLKGEFILAKLPAIGVVRFDCYGLFSKLKLDRTTYLTTISGVEEVGKLGDAVIFKINQVKLVNLKPSEPNIKCSIKFKLQRYKEVVESGNFYFSLDYPLFTTYQIHIKWKSNLDKDQLIDIGSSYVWNSNDDYEELDVQERDDAFVKAIYGSVTVTKTAGFTMALVARVDKHKLGPRYRARGLDKEGYSAMAAQLEMILFVKDKVYSYVQSRGSLPMNWAQPITKFNPKPRIVTAPTNPSLLVKHFDRLVSHADVDFIVMLNLLKNYGPEFELTQKFELLFKAAHLEHAELVSYPLGWGTQPINQLMDQMSHNLAHSGYFSAQIDQTTYLPKPVSIQHSLIRTNCLDSTDRTSLTQFTIFHRILAIILAENKQQLDCKLIGQTLRSSFVKVANDLANYYTGTGIVNQKLIDNNSHCDAIGTVDHLINFNRFFNDVLTDDLKLQNLKWVVDPCLMNGTDDGNQGYLTNLFHKVARTGTNRRAKYSSKTELDKLGWLRYLIVGWGVLMDLTLLSIIDVTRRIFKFSF